MPPLDHPDGIWQTSDWPGLEQGDLAWILIHDGVVLLMVTVETVVPALFRSLTRSSRVVLG